GAQDWPNADHVPPDDGACGPERLGVPRPHGRPAAGDETNPPPRGQAVGERPTADSSLHDADSEALVRLLHALPPVSLDFEEGANRVHVLRHDIRFLMDRLEIEQALPVDDVNAISPYGDLIQVGTVPRKVPGHLHDLGGR